MHADLELHFGCKKRGEYGKKHYGYGLRHGCQRHYRYHYEHYRPYKGYGWSYEKRRVY